MMREISTVIILTILLTACIPAVNYDTRVKTDWVQQYANELYSDPNLRQYADSFSSEYFGSQKDEPEIFI